MVQRIKFTKAALRAIPRPLKGQRNTVYHTIVPTLAVRVTSAGEIPFYLVKRVESGNPFHFLGTFPDMTIEQAEKAALRLLAQIADGKDPAKAKREARAVSELGQAFEMYMEQHIVPKRKSADEYRSMWERCLGEMPDAPRKKHGKLRTKHLGGVNWTHRKVTAISHDDVKALHHAIGKHNRTYANRVVELLSGIYGKYGLKAAVNPAAAIEPFDEAERERFLERGELPRFFGALATDNSDDFKEFIALCLLTGARRGNVLAMRWTDIDADRAVWTIPAGEAKAGKAMHIPLAPEAVTIIAARRERVADDDEPSQFVFPAPSKSGHLTPPKKRWAALFDRIELTEIANRIEAAGGKFEWKNDGSESLERAVVRARGIAQTLKIKLDGARMPTVRLHDLRRTLGSWQASLGASMLIVGKSLGHTSPSATAIYARLDMDPVRASVEAATSAMLVAGGLKKEATVTAVKQTSRRSQK